MVGPLEIDSLPVVMNGVAGNDDSGKKNAFWQDKALTSATDGAAVSCDAVMMTGRNGVADNGAGSNRMGGIEGDQRDAVTGHARDMQSFDNTIVAIFEMYAVPSAVGEHQIIQNQIVRRVTVLLVRINHAVCRDAVPAGRQGGKGCLRVAARAVEGDQIRLGRYIGFPHIFRTVRTE